MVGKCIKGRETYFFGYKIIHKSVFNKEKYQTSNRRTLGAEFIKISKLVLENPGYTLTHAEVCADAVSKGSGVGGIKQRSGDLIKMQKFWPKNQS